MKFDLTAMVRRVRNPRRRAIPIRDIAPTAVLATNLYRAGYLPVIEVWKAGSELILTEYTRTLAEMMTDSPADVRQEINSLDEVLQRLLVQLTPRLRDWAVRTESWFRGKWRGAVLSATGVDLQTLIGPEDARETVETFVARNASLVKDVSDQARGRISDAVFRGLSERRAARDVAKDIAEAVEMGRARAQRIASHQMASFAAELADERRREAGLDVWRWRHSGKRHPRQHHLDRDGNLYSESAARVGTEVDGETVKEAPDRNDWPGRPPFCGCRSQGVLVFD